ncbi:amidohydrolase [Meridianimaribacter sp. CL38]|uniref:amidohydrolase n=1 Tax=Meridianimaribacter sp. CL38 TaxID=2213021 RepID=UPI0010409E97|nr:amidohydrolase [Meridianimaribacter sp. CL38]TBV27600.1 amidohydrolase [Meridianimaribacter sp. CL38]
MKNLYLLLILAICLSCQNKEQVDTIVTNANVYTVDDSFTKAQAFAIKDGKFIAVGTNAEVNSKYTSENIVDANGKTIVPGFIDAHCHFLGLGLNEQQVDLVGTTSFEDMMKRVLDFSNKNNVDYILGRGWDETDWDDKTVPDNVLLSKLFPDTPILLRRVDGHSALCNEAALKLGNITANTKVDGGEVALNNGKPSGVLLDNAQALVLKHWPQPTKTEITKALLAAQDICFDYGLTTVDDAGLSRESIEIIDSLQQLGELNMRVYAMVSAKDTLAVDYYLKKGIYKTNKLNVRSFKVYADGALGSHGALLRQPYTDQPQKYGLLTTSINDLDALAQRISNSEYQMNTHAIGDSANHAVLTIYNKVLQSKPDKRWRVEHAQVVSQQDFEMYKTIVPSVQPTHATSDMYWAEQRLGNERVKGAYAYKQLLNAHGKIALGTDFPVEHVSPFLTFYAAVARQDTKQFPKDGFQKEDALTREEALKGMTIWAAYSNFEEHEKGSIEIGKFADFIVLDKDIMTVDVYDIPNIKVEQTFVDGVIR